VSDEVKRTILPPHWTLFCLLTEGALWYFLPVVRWSSLASLIGGGVVLALGLFLVLGSARLFGQAKTGLRPFSPSTALIVRGPYRFTRNPIYLGMTMILVGAALLFQAATPFVAPILFVIVINYRFIVYEERHMEQAFGADYLALKKRVRRWL
jgi:protein-S-isoprenylcysteine O-methyltransferase Ste14